MGGLAARTELGYTSGSGPSILNFGALGAALPLICLRGCVCTRRGWNGNKA